MIRKALVLTIAITAYLLFKKSWFALISLTVVVIFIYELKLRAHFWEVNTATSVGHLRSRLPALPYSEESYNAQFKTCFPRNKFAVREALFREKSNFTSPLLNFVDGLRKTSFVEPEKTYKHKIFIFGGSTIDCLEVPDDYTIASRLQKLLSNNGVITPSEKTKIPLKSGDYEVVNCGLSGATLSANFDHFQQLSFSKGDICLFYFGINETDISQIILDFKTPLSLLPKINNLRSKKFRKFLILQRLMRLTSTFDRNHIAFAEKVSEVSEVLTSLERYCIEHEMELFAIIQPFINTRSPVSKHDRDAFSLHWPRSHFDLHTHLFQRFADELRSKNFLVDFRTIFDKVDLDVYTEWCHTNYLGNQIIAENFHQLITNRLSNKFKL